MNVAIARTFPGVSRVLRVDDIRVEDSVEGWRNGDVNSEKLNEMVVIYKLSIVTVKGFRAIADANVNGRERNEPRIGDGSCLYRERRGAEVASYARYISRGIGFSQDDEISDPIPRLLS